MELIAFIINLHIYGSLDDSVLFVRKILPFIELGVFVIVIILTEVSLRKKFDKDGEKR
jgi:hypothetical protein